MAAAAGKEYNSPYEELVLTGKHPAKTQFMVLDDPPYIASQRSSSRSNRQRLSPIFTILSLTFVSPPNSAASHGLQSAERRSSWSPS